MIRNLIAVLGTTALTAAPAAAQTLTLGNLKAPIARASGQTPAKSVKDLWFQINGLPAFKPMLGDVVEPELGIDFTKVPSDIPTPVDVAAKLLQPAAVPADNGIDPVGAFRFICQPGQVSYDDPIVFPGQPGKSHLHQWYGNTLANGKSTYESLRSTGDSTCVNLLNRSAYWMPAMLNGKGKVVRPDFISIYYKNRPASDPECVRMAAKGCVALPRGLRMVFGYDMVSGKQPTGAGYFDCNGPTGTSGHFDTIPEAAKGCGAGNRLGAVINAPVCWDGRRLDSPNHRDHVGYVSYGSWGYPKCDDAHPFAIPGFTMGAWYGVDGERADSWYLSSDEMPGMPRMAGGTTFHADWFGAWDEATMAKWMANCINRHLNCDTGNLGNGESLKQTLPFAWEAKPRLIDIPPRPAS